LADAGLGPWVFVAPMLPMNPEKLAQLIEPHAHRVMVDPLNYRGQVQHLFRQHGWEYALTDEYAAATRDHLCRRLGPKIGG
jgi:DNA repair photolyase